MDTTTDAERSDRNNQQLAVAYKKYKGIFFMDKDGNIINDMSNPATDINEHNIEITGVNDDEVTRVQEEIPITGVQEQIPITGVQEDTNHRSVRGSDGTQHRNGWKCRKHRKWGINNKYH